MNVIIVLAPIYLIFLFLETLEASKKKTFQCLFKGVMLFYWLSFILFIFRYIILARIVEASINLNVIILIIDFLNTLLLTVYLYCRVGMGYKYYRKWIRK